MARRRRRCSAAARPRRPSDQTRRAPSETARASICAICASERTSPLSAPRSMVTLTVAPPPAAPTSPALTAGTPPAPALRRGSSRPAAPGHRPPAKSWRSIGLAFVRKPLPVRLARAGGQEPLSAHFPAMSELYLRSVPGGQLSYTFVQVPDPAQLGSLECVDSSPAVPAFPRRASPDGVGHDHPARRLPLPDAQVRSSRRLPVRARPLRPAVGVREVAGARGPTA